MKTKILKIGGGMNTEFSELEERWKTYTKYNIQMYKNMKEI